jgi:hypothetical protein
LTVHVNLPVKSFPTHHNSVLVQILLYASQGAHANERFQEVRLNNAAVLSEYMWRQSEYVHRLDTLEPRCTHAEIEEQVALGAQGQHVTFLLDREKVVGDTKGVKSSKGAPKLLPKGIILSRPIQKPPQTPAVAIPRLYLSLALCALSRKST